MLKGAIIMLKGAIIMLKGAIIINCTPCQGQIIRG
jgi:hypothetical protein